MDTFRYFGDFVAPWGRYIFGTMKDRGEIKTFVYDMEEGVNYTLDRAESGPLFESFLTISGGRLVVTFPTFDGETLPSDLPGALRSGVLSGNPLIGLYELK